MDRPDFQVGDIVGVANKWLQTGAFRGRYENEMVVEVKYYPLYHTWVILTDKDYAYRIPDFYELIERNGPW